LIFKYYLIPERVRWFATVAQGQIICGVLIISILSIIIIEIIRFSNIERVTMMAAND